MNILRNGSNVNVFNSLIEAKEYCSNDPNCYGVQNKTESTLTYYACAYPTEISTSDIERVPTDLYKKIRVSGNMTRFLLLRMEP